MSAEDALVPWSVSYIFKNIESDADYRNKLLAMADRLPDVASRTILCPLFSRRLIQQTERSSALHILSSMCRLAIAQQRRYDAEIRGESGNCEKEGKVVTAVDEVTFAAQIVGSFINTSVLDLSTAFLPFSGTQRPHHLTILASRTQEATEYFHKLCKNEGCARVAPTAVRRTFSLLPAKREPRLSRHPLPFSRRYNLPACMTALHCVAQDIRPAEQRGLLRKLDTAGPALRVHSRDTLNEKLARKRRLEKKAVPSSLSRPAPQLIRRETSAPDAPPTPDPRCTTDQSEPLHSKPSSVPQEPIPNATWVKDGDLRVVNGKIVYFEEKLDDSDNKNDIPIEASEIETMKTREDQSKKKKDSTKKSNRITDKNVRKDRKHNASPKIKHNRHPQQSIPLKSREELIEMVEALDVSSRLRQTFWIGLAKREDK
ncbi:hypothetical protein, conserved [Trypanosoma brucei gambiense DAL972]|uniref:Uncharacterized protein n=1 Tax=Trypanosoma brucei gambiense (strain MHOM/CI/86/DAL972) TaxID=679716 RepID=D0A4R7_TRYB9|nr:hypothetical protein, conserved [Trypanosoma brucei gambiense DAL972]CBH16261.1 hypothetical protein, conserved [Trypanosoma brucei gambiense DAL972]|eukprot:XP_011778525.1 hypothetical protein, conserved [Trypanosoma brucei gambiense DAL972]